MELMEDYEANAWERASIHESEATTPTSYSHPRSIYNQRPMSTSNRPGSIHSSIADVPGADYYRDASPLGLSHSSRNLREHASRQSLRQSTSSPYLAAPGPGRPGMPDPRQSMAGLSMWGGGSQYGPSGPGSEMYQMHPQMQMQMQQQQMMSPGYFNPHAPFQPGQQMNPFDSPHSGSEHGSVRGHSFYPPQQGMHPGMGAPRNTVMSNLAGMASGGMPNPRMSTFSLATTANPLQNSVPLEPSDDPSPEDGEVLSVLRRYLAQQDLMSV